MARVGDGTGQGAQPPRKQGATANENKTVNDSPTTGQGEGGTGPQLASPGNRKTPRGGKK
jgi:hypothetical protein